MLRFERAQFLGAVRLFAVFMLTLPAVAQDHSSPVETRTDASRPENVLEKSHTLSIEAVDGQSRLGTIVLQVFRSSPRQAGITGDLP